MSMPWWRFVGLGVFLVGLTWAVVYGVLWVRLGRRFRRFRGSGLWDWETIETGRRLVIIGWGGMVVMWVGVVLMHL